MSDNLLELLRERSRSSGNREPTWNWTIAESTRGGKGVFATRNISAGELIFTDLPILRGPTSSEKIIGCSVCLEQGKPLRNCVNNCHLPMCSEECENDESHRAECELLRKLEVKEEEWSPKLFKSLTLVRSLLVFDLDRKIVKLLHAKDDQLVDRQISNFLDLFHQPITEKDQEWVKRCCGVMDGTAFRIESSDKKHSSKGLFPLSAVMNHDCTPNTRRVFSNKASGCQMLVFATKFIPEGEEILANYCPVFWDTKLRRSFLIHTKRFECRCERCSDPTEFGTNLQALQCDCGDLLLPIDPLDLNSDWQCRKCNTIETNKRVMAARNTGCGVSLPKCHYMSVLKKIEDIFKIFKAGNFQGLSTDQQKDVLRSCTEIVRLNDKLKLGDTPIKGKILHEMDQLVKAIGS